MREPEADPIVTVGPGGDHATLGEALASGRVGDHAERFPEIPLVLRLTRGFVLDEQVVIRRRRLGGLRIEAEEAVVPIRREALIREIGVDPYTRPRFPAFAGLDGAELPVLDCVFVMDDSGPWERRDGLVLAHGARAHLRPGAGIQGTGWSRDTREDEGAGIGAFVLTGSTLLADGATFDHCARAIYARFGSQVNFRHGTARHCGWTAIQLMESYMTCENAILTDAGHYGLRARRTSYCNAQGVDVSRSNGHGVNSNEGSKINFRDGVARDCGWNRGDDYNDPPEQGMLATECSTISAMNAVVTEAATNAVFARAGSFIDFRDGEASSGSGAPALRVENGSFIAAGGAQGSLSQIANLVTGDGAILDPDRALGGRFEVAEGQSVRLRPGLPGGRMVLIANGEGRSPDLRCSGEFFYDVGQSPDLMTVRCGKHLKVVLADDEHALEGVPGACTVVLDQGAIRVINRRSPPGRSIRFRYRIA